MRVYMFLMGCGYLMTAPGVGLGPHMAGYKGKCRGSGLQPLALCDLIPFTTTASSNSSTPQAFEWTGEMVAVSRQKVAVALPEGATFDTYLATTMPEDIEAETELDTEGKPDRSRLWFKKAARVRGERGSGQMASCMWRLASGIVVHFSAQDE